MKIGGSKLERRHGTETADFVDVCTDAWDGIWGGQRGCNEA